MLKALIWDVDGTVAETERDGHRVAFNQAFEALGLPWRWSATDYGPLLQITGGRERLLHDMQRRPDAPRDAAARQALALDLHRRKNAFYAVLVAQGGIALRPGVLRLMDECGESGVRLAVATTTGRANVDALFDSCFGLGWQSRFSALVCAEDAPIKKPDPQAYLLALRRLRVSADDAFAIEDSPNGLLAARAAGLRCGIARSAYFQGPAFDGADWVQDDLDSPTAITLSSLFAAAKRAESKAE